MRSDNDLWDYYREWEVNLSTIEPNDEQINELLSGLTEAERERLQTLFLRRMSQLDQAAAKTRKRKRKGEK